MSEAHPSEFCEAKRASPKPSFAKQNEHPPQNQVLRSKTSTPNPKFCEAKRASPKPTTKKRHCLTVPLFSFKNKLARKSYFS